MSATQRRDLRTGRSIWMSRRLPALARRRLTRDVSADVLVVGAGISGAMVADALSDAGLRVVIVDRRAPVSGSTAASTALLQYEIDTPLTRLSRSLGTEWAERIWRRSKLALDALRERTRFLGLPADIEERESLYLDGTVLDADGLRQEADARRAAGFEVQLLRPREVAAHTGITGRHGLLGFGNLSADPRQLAGGLLSASLARGARLYSPTEVSEVESGRSEVRAVTSEGPVIRARHLVFATGYELPHGVPRDGHSIVSTWAIATRLQPRRVWPSQCFIWEASEPYLYLRVGPGGRVICGGEDEPFSDAAARDALIPEKTRTLEARLARLVPGIDARAATAWCGSFGASTTGTPTIGAVPGMRGCFAVLGYGGNGITFSAMAAQILRNTLTGRPDSDAELFAF